MTLSIAQTSEWSINSASHSLCYILPTPPKSTPRSTYSKCMVQTSKYFKYHTTDSLTHARRRVSAIDVKLWSQVRLHDNVDDGTTGQNVKVVLVSPQIFRHQWRQTRSQTADGNFCDVHRMVRVTLDQMKVTQRERNLFNVTGFGEIVNTRRWPVQLKVLRINSQIRLELLIKISVIIFTVALKFAFFRC